jgi:hypothetical protein
LIPIDSQSIDAISADFVNRVFSVIPIVPLIVLDSVAVASLLHEAFNTTYRAFDFQLSTDLEKLS